MPWPLFTSTTNQQYSNILFLWPAGLGNEHASSFHSKLSLHFLHSSLYLQAHSGYFLSFCSPIESDYTSGLLLMKQYARIQFNSRQNMTITSWRLSSCEDPLLFEIPADTSQPKGDAIQAVHNFLGDLAQCVWAASPSLPWRHSPAPGFPRLGTPCQSARPRWPQYGTCVPRWPPQAPMWAILRS